MNISNIDSLKRVNSIHILRGITIIIIVMCHCYGKFHITDIPNKMTSGSSYYFFFSELTFSWTVSFVLIAGFLFQHLSPKFSIKKYYYSKVKNVIIPYIVVTLFLFLILYKNYINENDIINIFYQFSYLLLKGNISWPLWFIPMIIIIYILSPVFKMLSDKNLLILSLFCFLWLLMYPRPANNLKVFVMFFYFLPVYIIGMSIRQNYNLLMSFMRKIYFACRYFFLLFYFLHSFYIKLSKDFMQVQQY